VQLFVPVVLFARILNPEPKKDKRVPVMMTAAELKAIDDWRFTRRIHSRSEAIRQLVALGLKAEEGASRSRDG
jgi:metal-responsive CopG/Arc/MetJ family transcriptional regulator